jgi:hypothetical protein
LALLLLAIDSPVFGQALPAAEAAPVSTGFSKPTTSGTLNYAISGSESIYWGYYGNSGSVASTNVTGDLAYLSNSKLYPFSAVFSGGHSWGTSSIPSYSFLNLGLSQVVNVGRWDMLISDSVSYLPGTPTTGLSGVAGVGDLGVNPVQVGPSSGQGVLTNYSSRVGNTVSGNVQRQITGKTAISGSGNYSVIRFLDDTGNTSNSGLDWASEGGGASISHQIDARNSVGGNYLYSSYTYRGVTFGVAASSFSSQTGSLQYSHRFTRKLSVTLIGGPQWTSVDTPGSSPLLSAYANASGDYEGRLSRASLTYSRGTNSGNGVIGGAQADSVGFNASRTFAVVWNAAVSTSYTRTSSLPGQTNSQYLFNTTVGSVQISRAIVRSLSAYASYTAENQSNSSSAVAVDVFSGLTQVVGFGLTFSPNSIHLGRQ